MAPRLKKEIVLPPVATPAPALVETPLRLDLGCGPHPREGFTGVDRISFPDVAVVCDLGRDSWPWEDSSVEETHTSHFVEHLDAIERVYFCNELYRVSKPGAKCTLIVPHWASCRAYGDPTHKFPPISEFWFYYLSREWRRANAPHTDAEHWDLGFSCDFEATWGYTMHATIIPRNAEYQQYAMSFYKEAIQDVIATLTCRK